MTNQQFTEIEKAILVWMIESQKEGASEQEILEHFKDTYSQQDLEVVVQQMLGHCYATVGKGVTSVELREVQHG